MKKILNKPADCVREMLEGIALSRSDVDIIPEHKIVIRRDIEELKQRQVILISGGGSGHEPAHAGYIGAGALGAVVCGEVFSSPSQASIYAAIKACGGPHGVLLIVKNYTGDKINFKLAAERAKIEDGIKVETVVIADDVALLTEGDDLDRAASVGARGLAGVVFLHKYAGALASSGMKLEEIAEKSREFSRLIKTMGVAMTPCVIPSLGKSTFEIAPDEMELGLGIHGEHGLEKAKLKPADEIVDYILNKIMKFLSLAHGAKSSSTSCALLVNNLGSATVMEMSIIARAVLLWFGKRYPQISIERCYVGQYLTAMEMSGFSISVAPVNAEIVSCLDQETAAPAWLPVRSKPNTSLSSAAPEATGPKRAEQKTLSETEEIEIMRLVRSAFAAVCDAFERNADHLTALDAAVGDGDLGSNLQTACQALRPGLASKSFSNAENFFTELAYGLQQHLGGTSGPMYSIFFLRLAKKLAESDPNALDWSSAFKAGIEGIEYLGDAKEGDRTMLDALWPAQKALQTSLHAGKSAQEALLDAANAASSAVESTKKLIAKRGRSSYLRERVLGHVDPGAKAVEVAIQAIYDDLCNTVARVSHSPS